MIKNLLILSVALSIASIGVSILFVSCSTPLVWGLHAEEFKSRLLDGTLPQLDQADTASDDPGELAELGPGAAYFISFHEFADPDASLRLLLSQVEAGEEPYAFAAALEAAEQYLQQENYTSLRRLYNKTEERYSDIYSWRRLYLLGLYWGREDAAALNELEKLKKDFPHAAKSDVELNLFSVVLAQRNSPADDQGWVSRVLNFFIANPAGNYHIRLYDYLRLEGLLDIFSGDDQILLYAVDQTARGNGEVSWPLLKGLLEEEPYLSASMLMNLANAVTTSARREATVKLLLEIADSNKALEESSIEAAAWLYRRAGYHRAAGDLYGRLPENERTRWYIFSSRVRSNPSAAVELLPQLLMEIDDPDYYSDVLQELAALLAEREEWGSVIQAYRYLDGGVNRRVLTPFAYIAARVQQAGVTSPGITDLSADNILRRIARGEYPGAGSFSPQTDSALDYYTLLAGYFTGNTFFPAETPAEPSVPVQGYELSDTDKLIYGFLEYGLPEKALQLASDGDVSVAAALAAGAAAAEGPRPDESLRMLLRRNRDPGAAIPVSALYPRPWMEQVHSAAEEFNLPPWLLYALIRRESLFNPGAVSRVGAGGLMQLMPETAADVAARLKQSEYDVTLVEDNLRFGSWYLRNMLDRTDSPADAVASYNAGISRVRSWRRAFGKLPGDLFVEAMPYAETRNYVKSLLVSSVYYGYLYHGESADRIVEDFFPDLVH